MKNVSIYLLFILVSSQALAQKNYPCTNNNNLFLSKIIGQWQFRSKDRVSPDIYEQNEGQVEITNLIHGCGIQISLKDHPYAVSMLIIVNDQNDVEMTYLDTEHGSFLHFKGKLITENINVFWYRDFSKKKLQVKQSMRKRSNNEFELNSYLSSDHGAT